MAVVYSAQVYNVVECSVSRGVIESRPYSPRRGTAFDRPQLFEKIHREVRTALLKVFTLKALRQNPMVLENNPGGVGGRLGEV